MKSEVINIARESLKNFGILELPIRKKLWLELGQIEKTTIYAAKTEGLKKRVSLAIKCINKVKDIWNNKDIDLEKMLKSINDYLDDNISADELLMITNDYRQQVEEIAYGGEELYGVVGMACCYVGNIALYDEPIIYCTGDEDLDEDLDSFTWDTSYLVSLVFSTDESNKRITEYWKWYLENVEEML